MRLSRAFFLLGCFVAVAGALLLSPLPTFETRADNALSPVKDLPTESEIQNAIQDLSSADFKVRETATRKLWSAGAAAEPALKRAMENASPEVARRIRKILSNLAYGITPDMPPEVVELIAQYRAGDLGAKRPAALALAERGGASGASVLLNLRNEEQDPRAKSMVTSIIVEHARDLAVSLIGAGDTPGAREILATSVASDAGDEDAARDYAAFLLTTGGLDIAIVEWQGKLLAKVPGAAVTLTHLFRAKGDLANARVMAERSGSGPLLRNVLIEIGDWKELAKQSMTDVEHADAENLCFAAAFNRLAGDETGVDKLAGMLAQAADRQPDRSDAWTCAEGLFLAGRTDAGIELLVKHQQFAAAIDLQSQRLAFDEMPRLVERARARLSEDLGQVEVKAARVAWFMGDPRAELMLSGAVKACEQRRDLPGLIAAVGAANEMGLPDRARWHAVTALQTADLLARAQPGTDPTPVVKELVEKARFRNAERGAGWWQILRQRFPRDPVGKTFETMRAIDARSMEAGEFQALCAASATAAMRRAPDLRDAQLELIADTLLDAGRREEASARYVVLAKLARESNPSRAAGALSKLAALDADAGRWKSAADQYAQAWQLDQANPVPLALSGWAVEKSGDAPAGRQRMERAHVISLSDQNRRFDLVDALLQRKLPDGAGREREVILRTAEFMSWRRSEALRRAGDDAHASGDFAGAIDLWERAFLDNNDAKTRFIDPWANVSIPTMIRRTRAIASIRARNSPDAQKYAQACLAQSPGDADGVIELVAAFDAAGQKTEGDAFYQAATARYRTLCEKYPQSGPLHNLYAWAAAKCGRELDAALTHAKRAVELQPTNTASLDTLAETHFQRKEFAQALAAMQRCAELEPTDPRHKAQLDRFRKAAKGVTDSKAP